MLSLCYTRVPCQQHLLKVQLWARYGRCPTPHLVCSRRLAARPCGSSAGSLSISSLGGHSLRLQIAQFWRGCTIIPLASLQVLNAVILQVSLQLLEQVDCTDPHFRSESARMPATMHPSANAALPVLASSTAMCARIRRA